MVLFSKIFLCVTCHFLLLLIVGLTTGLDDQGISENEQKITLGLRARPKQNYDKVN